MYLLDTNILNGNGEQVHPGYSQHKTQRDEYQETTYEEE